MRNEKGFFRIPIVKIDKKRIAFPSIVTDSPAEKKLCRGFTGPGPAAAEGFDSIPFSVLL